MSSTDPQATGPDDGRDQPPADPWRKADEPTSPVPPYLGAPEGVVPSAPSDPTGAPYGAAPAYGSPQPYGAVAPYAAGPQAYPGYPGYPGYRPPLPKNNLAVWSLVLGICSFVLSCFFVTGIPAVIIGNNAKRAVERGEADNPGMATAGVVLGWIAIGLSALLLLFWAAWFVFVVVLGVVGATVDGTTT